jgi:tetratricopeptide (TPR) repeat protein
MLGIAESELRQTQIAKDAFEHGLALEPNSISLNENEGLLFYQDGDYRNAKKYLNRAVVLGSQNDGVRFSLAGARLRTGEEAEALKEIVALEPALGNVPAYWEERGRAELPKDAALAEGSFNRAIELQPASVSALNGAATAAEKQGKDEKALAYLIRARSANPNDVTTLVHFGSVCLRRDLGPDARDALKKAHELDPANNTVVFLLARAKIALENWQAAYDLFEQFSKRVPGYAPAYYAMGWVDVRLDRTADARKQFEKALAIDRRMTGPKYELALVDVDDGQLDAAEGLLRAVLKENPSDAKANMTLGDIMMRRGNLDEAQRLLEHATQDDPTLGAAHFKLAAVYSRKRQEEAAARERGIATKLNADAKRESKTQLRLILPEAATGY